MRYTRREALLALAMQGETRRAGEETAMAGMRLCWCPAGRFRMGSPADEPGRRADEEQVEVTLTRGFWMGKYEVTQRQWVEVCGPLPRAADKGAGPEFPVYWVNYGDCLRFCERLTARARREGTLREPWAFRLPTEAEWEYACRAGTTTAFAFGQELRGDRANIGGGPGVATPVGSFAPNAWGIHDMHGNEFEWCLDWYHSRLPGGVDPDLSGERGQANRDGSYSRVRRGGGWNDLPQFCRSALRLRYEPERASDHIGFRVVAAGR